MGHILNGALGTVVRDLISGSGQAIGELLMILRHRSASFLSHKDGTMQARRLLSIIVKDIEDGEGVNDALKDVTPLLANIFEGAIH
jgi:hypothetical protein